MRPTFPMTSIAVVMGALAVFLAAGCSSHDVQMAKAEGSPVFTRADTLRGMLSGPRACYDVRWYHLDVRIDPANRTVAGSTTIRFTALGDCSRMQVDLSDTMNVESIILDDGGPLSFTRESGAMFITVPDPLAAGSTHRLIVRYAGSPRVAANPPWDGGFIWTKDDAGNPWVAVACEGKGASLWWPNKDHPSDEPDSMLISITVPSGLQDVSNGRLRKVTELPDGWSRYDWGVTYPINNYNVTVNIGRFARFGETSVSGDTLTLDYYVLPSHLDKARKQFTQVIPMLACFEKYFGKYPFARDGYKLVESPYLGMEHQGAIAYGNKFRQGNSGWSSSKYGIKFDYIIIHESAHEWWGNSVTASDMADLWIHEAFATYAEALYVGCMEGEAAMLAYVNSLRQQVGNRAPILGAPNVNNEGSGDMYAKGALMLHTLRGVLDDDSLWYALIRGIAGEFRCRTVTTEDVIAYVNKTTGTDYTSFFEQYLRHPALPRLEVRLATRGDSTSARYRWRADVPAFHMRVKVTTAADRFAFIAPTTAWQTLNLGTMDPRQFRVAEDLFYIDTQIHSYYQDPN